METGTTARGGGIALVAGGSGGIGSAISTTLAQSGSDVAIIYHSREDKARAVASEIEAMGRKAPIFRCDLLDPASLQVVVDRLIAEHGHIHSVVYASGPPIKFLRINEILPDEWSRVITGDVMGCFNLVAAVLPHLRAQNGGSLVAITTAAVDRPPPRDILSAAPKAAIQMLFRGIAREEGRSGVRANCVGPGYIEAGLALEAVDHHTDDYVAKMVRAVPLRRAGQAQEIADAVAFLLSDEARYISGETISVAGGAQC